MIIIIDSLNPGKQKLTRMFVNFMAPEYVVEVGSLNNVNQTHEIIIFRDYIDLKNFSENFNPFPFWTKEFPKLKNGIDIEEQYLETEFEFLSFDVRDDNLHLTYSTVDICSSDGSVMIDSDSNFLERFEGIGLFTKGVR